MEVRFKSGFPHQDCTHPRLTGEVLSMSGRQKASEPEELGRFFMERGNAGDLDGLVELYEPTAVLAFPSGKVIGHKAIRQVYAELLATKPKFQGSVQAALRNGDLALTSTRFSGGATSEVAHRQPDGTWLWVIDQPNLLR